MGIRHLACASRAQALGLCIEEAKSAVGQCGVVSVITSTSEDADELKLALCEEGVLGIHVQSLPHWIAGEWELWGDGRKLADENQRHILLRPILSEVTGLEPSASYVKQFSSFVKDALACDAQIAEPSIAGALASYKELLEEKGMADPSIAMRAVASANGARPVVVYCLEEGRPFAQAFIDALSEKADVVSISRCLPCDSDEGDAEGELKKLRKMLFTGEGGLVSDACFEALEVHGTHAEGEAVSQLVRRVLELGATPSQVAVAFPSGEAAYPSVVQALAQAGIPVSCRYCKAFEQTAFGSAFLQLERLLKGEDNDWSNDASFLTSAYSGMDDRDARAFAAVWRSQSGATKEERLEALLKGLKRSVPSKVWAAKLNGICALLSEPDMDARVRLMFENGRKASFDLDRMADDAAAANVLLAYLEDCAFLGRDPHVKDIEQLKVSLACAFGDEASETVRICSAEQLPALSGVTHVVFARLNKDDYPMATQPAPFDRYLEDAGCNLADSTALKNRLLLADALEVAEHFACYRLMSDSEGSENCQSALWDELMTSYRDKADSDSPVHVLPQALVDNGCGLRIAEADVFGGSRQVVEERLGVKRGEVDEAALELLFPDSENYNECFSPTAIEDYYRCPYRWLICRRIGANSIDKEFDQIAKGNLAHAVLERLYVNMHEAGIPRVTPQNLDQCLAMADEAFEQQRQHDIDKHNLFLHGEREWEESEFVRRQVRELVKRDATFLPGFRPTYLELKLETPDGQALTYAGVPVRGKVDRIDVDELGRAVVIDYKLSSLGSGYGLSKEGGLPTRIQTDIYALLVQRCLEMQGVDIKVVGSVYRSYAKNNLRGAYAHGLDWGPDEKVRLDLDAMPGGACLDTYDQYIESVEAKVAELLEKMKSGDVRPSPLCKDACEHCLAVGFCHERRG